MNIKFVGTVAELRLFTAHLRVKEEVLQKHVELAQKKVKWFGNRIANWFGKK